MDASAFHAPQAGRVVRAPEGHATFIPAPLPPLLEYTPALVRLLSVADAALSELSGIGRILPNPHLLIAPYVRREAVLSSRIEGTRTSLSDLLADEAGQSPQTETDDVREVRNYVSALDHGIARLSQLPLSLRLVRELHRILMSGVRGERATPGEFRRSQNWIGGTRPGNAYFVPPPAENVLECLGELEKFLHNMPQATPPLLKAALAHVQFETIHPFLDGNGRLGRLLITLILCEQQVLREPLLYLSLYFKEHRQYYYDLLNTIRATGDWETWLQFFAEAVTATATQGVESISTLAQMADADRAAIAKLGRAAPSVEKIHAAMLERPIVSAGWLAEKTGLTPATVNKSLNHMESLGIISQLGNGKRNRLFAYSRYMQILNDE